MSNDIDNLFDYKNKLLEDILLTLWACLKVSKHPMWALSNKLKGWIYNNNNSAISLEDIHYYIYHLKQNNGTMVNTLKNLKLYIKELIMNITKTYSEKNVINIISN